MGGYFHKLKSEFSTLAIWRDIFAEFVGTFFLVSVQCALPLPWHKANGLTVGLGMGFIVCTMGETTGPFSGGHLNPAVTFAMSLALEITFLRGIFYMIAQCAGGIAGAGFVYGMTPEGRVGNLALTVLADEVTWWQGMMVEAWATCILVMTIFGATNAFRKKVVLATVPIGFAVALGIMSAFEQTGAGMNPARSLGPAVIMGVWDDHWVYWAGPFLGAGLATVVYKLVFDRIGGPKPEEDNPEKEEVFVMN